MHYRLTMNCLQFDKEREIKTIIALGWNFKHSNVQYRKQITASELNVDVLVIQTLF